MPSKKRAQPPVRDWENSGCIKAVPGAPWRSNTTPRQCGVSRWYWCAVHNLGHAHPVVTHAIAEQAATLVQTSNQFYTVPQLLLAHLLIEHSCLDRVFFGNSGAEANEGALKLARKYGRQQ